MRLGAGTKTKVTVLGPDEDPVPGVRVVPTIQMKGRISIPEILWDRAGRTTDDKGQAVLDAFESNEVTLLRAFSERFGMQQWAGEKIEAGPDQKVINLVAAGSFSGRVITADGKPLPGTKVIFATLADGVSGPYTGVVKLTTDDDGKFTIPAIPSGKLIIRSRRMTPRSRMNLARSGHADRGRRQSGRDRPKQGVAGSIGDSSKMKFQRAPRNSLFLHTFYPL